MKRRGVLASMAGLVAGLFGARAVAGAMPVQDKPAEEASAIRARALANFPYPHVTVPGTEALTTWERLRREGKGWPVIVGNDEEFAQLIDGFGANSEAGPAAILAAAGKVRLPGDLKKAFAEEYGGEAVAEEGEWPARGKAGQPGLTVASDILTGKPHARVHIVQLPTVDGSEAPAYLRWGGWNACPAPELHVALLRQWKQGYGAELVGLSGDTMNLRVARHPASREEALAVAREQYLYCVDIVDQGVGALRPLAASLMESDWWFFWWD